MHRLLAIFFIGFLPLQLTWAAVNAYSQHHAESPVETFGHHDHQHAAVDGNDASPDLSKYGGGDPDCAACHAGCASFATDALALFLLADPSLDIVAYRARVAAPVSQRPERPQWPAPA